MMVSEFIERTGFEPTASEYKEIEAEYMGTGADKDKFCKDWKKNSGPQRLMRLRARKIEELEAEIIAKDRLCEELDTRHSRSFNEMKDTMELKYSELEAQYKQCFEANTNLCKMLHEEQAARKEAEEKLEKVREAFAVLGLVKEG